MPWDFKIERPEDVGVFADLLEEWQHPGAPVGRHLARNGKFPLNTSGHPYPCWTWEVSVSIAVRDDAPHKLPLWSLRDSWGAKYFTATEAVWAVVNAGQYRKWS